MVDKILELRAEFIDHTVQGTLSVFKVPREQKTIEKVDRGYNLVFCCPYDGI